MKSAQRAMGRMRARPKVDEARDILANVVVCHVPVVHYNFQQKVQPASVPQTCVLLMGFTKEQGFCCGGIMLWR